MNTAMTTEEIKQTIHQLVDTVRNDVTLIDLHTAVSLIIEQQDLPLDADTGFLQARLTRGLQQFEQGQYTTNEQMKQLTAQWLSK